MIGIIIVNYKGANDTIYCVKSVLQSQINVPYTIFIIDNNSGQKDVSNIRSAFDLYIKGDADNVYFSSNFPIYLIESDINKGFAYGNNLGIKFAQNIGTFTYFWLLNNDTIIEKDTMANLYEAIQNLPNHVGILGNKLMFMDNPKCIQAIGGVYDKFFSRSKHIGAYEHDNGQYDTCDIKMDYVVGASMFVKSDFIQTVGFMNEEYFLYFEEIDWILRGKEKGWTISYTPVAKVYHKEGGSTTKRSNGQKNVIADSCLIRNRILFTRKFYPSYIVTVYIGCIITIIKKVLLGDWNRAKLLTSVLYHTL